MMVWGLDLGTATGFAYGEAGAIPESGSIILKKKKDPRGIALGNLIWFLNDRWSQRKPDLVVKEAPMSLQGFMSVHSSEANVRMHHSLHGIVEGMCARFDVPLREEHNATVRKHFIGRGNFGDRELTKGAIVRRCQLLGYIPNDCDDQDRADALANFDWACATFARKSLSTTRLVLFEQKPGERDDGDE